MGKRVIDLTIVWLLLAGLLSFLYYYLSGNNGPKIALIFAEFLLTFVVAYWFLKKDFQEITDSNRLHLTYSLKRSRNPNSRINSIIIVTMIIFSFITFAPIVYCGRCMCNGSLKGELVLKTAISIVLAFGCVMTFGKITLGYAIDELREISTELANCYQKVNMSAVYENLD